VKIYRFIGLFLLITSFPFKSPGQSTIRLEIVISEPSPDSDETMLKKLRLTNPMDIRLSDLTSKIEKILRFYEDSGFPFIRVRLDSVKMRPDLLSGVLVIEKGELIMIDTLMNRTGFRLSPGVLYRLLNIRPDDRYRESAINQAAGRLSRITYMSQTRPLEVGFHPGKASVYFYPEKANANRFDGWVGLSPDLRKSGMLAFSGALALNLSNILGQGENWQFDWRRNQDTSQKLNLSALVPYLLGMPFGFQGKFELFRQDTSYLNVSWDAGIPYHLDGNQQVNLFVRHRESNVLLSSEDIPLSALQSFTSFVTGLTWELDRLDSRLNPYRGFGFRIEASTGRKSLPDSISMQQSEFTANISWFQPLSKSLTCGLFLQSGYRMSPEIYKNEMFRLGGLNQLRGFDEDVFQTDAFAVTSVEVRYLLDRTSHLVFLTDLGFLRSRENGILQLKTPLGMGLGGQIRTAGGIFRIIFALGKESGQPFNFKNSKIHLGYVGVF
jgi:outer membrane protein assembly factor BamA